MKGKIKKALVSAVPYGIIEKHRSKQKELEAEQKRLQEEQNRLEKEQKRLEEKRINKERLEKERLEKKNKAQKKKEAKIRNFLMQSASPEWEMFYAEYHEKEQLEETWILYEYSSGIGMGGNPYAIFKSFEKMPEFADYIHIWAIQGAEENRILQDEYRQYRNVIFIHFHSQAYAYFLAKARYLITNSFFPHIFSKKQNQVLINTWNSTAVKKLGYDMPNGRKAVKNMIRNMLMADYIISPNEFMSKIIDKSFRLTGLFEGRYIEEGRPGSDLVRLTNREEIIRKLRVRGTRVDSGKKIILYAPVRTKNNAANFMSDMQKFTGFYSHLTRHITTDEYQILMRPHKYIYENLTEEWRKQGCFVFYGIDMNELLSVTDILVTDYSEIFFDFLHKGKPILFYLPDMQSYQGIQGVHYKLDELPGPYANDLDGLAAEINGIQTYTTKYQEIRDKIFSWACPYDDGKVSERMIDIIFRGEKCYRLLPAVQTGKKKILMYAGAFRVNGITSAALSLLNAIDYETYDVTLFVIELGEKLQENNLHRIPSEVRVLMRYGKIILTERQQCIYESMMREGFLMKANQLPELEYLMRREYMRCFGASQYDYIIDFSGYAPYFTCLTAKQCPQAKKFIWQHSDIKEDFMNTEKQKMNKTVARLQGLLSVYPYYDRIVSASKMVYEINKKKLAAEETRDKFTYCTNLMDEAWINKHLHGGRNAKMDGMDYIGIENGQGTDGFMNMTFIPFPSDKGVKFVTVGRCMPEKNHRSLILALKRLVSENVSCMLYIVGDGYMREELEALAKEECVSDRVIITGFVTNPFAVLNKCDCFIFPSSYEAQGLAVLEARAVGLPIVVSNYPAVESVLIKDGQYIIEGTDADDVYRGMRAFLEGKVLCDYNFDIEDYNHKAYREFINLLNGG